jgi:hypothetical protein
LRRSEPSRPVPHAICSQPGGRPPTWHIDDSRALVGLDFHGLAGERNQTAPQMFHSPFVDAGNVRPRSDRIVAQWADRIETHGNLGFVVAGPGHTSPRSRRPMRHPRGRGGGTANLRHFACPRHSPSRGAYGPHSVALPFRGRSAVRQT